MNVNSFTSHPAIWLQEYSRIHKSCEGKRFYITSCDTAKEYSHMHISC